MSEQLLSVVLPVRNGAAYLVAALESILGQSMGDFTLHVSDNASDDGTAEILADFAARDRRVVVSRTEQILPQPDNVNRAVSLASSRWLKLFCHDDLMRADCLAQVRVAIEQVEGSKVALICNGERHLYGNGYLTEVPQVEGLEILSGHEAIARKLWRVQDPVAFPALTTATVRRDALAAIGGFDRRYLYFDLFAWLELLISHDYAALSAPLTVNRIHSAQVAMQARTSLREAEDFRQFMPAFIARHGAALGMSPKDRLRVRMIAAALAARAIGGQLAAGKPWRAVQTFARAPSRYWPILPLLSLRAWRLEDRRARALEPHVPREWFYPL